MQQRPNGLGSPAGLADHAAHIVRMNMQFNTLSLFAINDANLNVFRMFDEFLGDQLNKFFHRSVSRRPVMGASLSANQPALIQQRRLQPLVQPLYFYRRPEYLFS